MAGKRGVGRPTRYNNNVHPQRAHDLCLMGARNEDLAMVFEVTRPTIDNWLKKHKDFREAVYDGRAYADATVAKSLYRQAIGFVQKQRKPMVVSKGANMGSEVEVVEYEETVNPNSTAAIFWLKNRRPNEWRDKKEIDTTGGLFGVVVIEEEDDENTETNK